MSSKLNLVVGIDVEAFYLVGGGAWVLNLLSGLVSNGFPLASLLLHLERNNQVMLSA